AAPLAASMRDLLRSHLGRSLEAAAAAEHVNYDWWLEFPSQTSRIGTTFAPSLIGFSAALDNISSMLDGQAEIAPVTGALVLYLAGWTFLAGGILDRYA